MAGCDAYSNGDFMDMQLYFAATKRKMMGCLLALGCGTGGRISELLALQRADLINDNGFIRDRIRLVKLKTGVKTDTREILWPHVLDKFVFRWLAEQQVKHGLEYGTDFVFQRKADGRLSRWAAWDSLRKAHKVVGLRGKYGTHGMRKFYARRMYAYYCEELGDTLNAVEMVRSLLGHADISTTIKYLDFRSGSEATAVKKVFGFVGEGDNE